MSILYLEYGGDLQLTPNGTLALASGWDEIRQSLERALLTNPAQTLSDGSTISADYIYDPTFGEGLLTEVDASVTQGVLSRLKARIAKALAQNPNVAYVGDPSVSLTKVGQDRFQLLIVVPLKNGATGSLNITGVL